MLVFAAIAVLAFTARLAAAEPESQLDTLAPHASASELDEAASFDPSWADAGSADDRDAAHHAAPTRLGRVDLTIAWRRTLRTADTRTIDASVPIASPLDPVTTARGVLWILVTWSR